MKEYRKPPLSRRNLLLALGSSIAALPVTPLLAASSPDDTVESRLKELEIELPGLPESAANYVPYVEENGFVYIAGQLPMVDGELILSGKLGAEATLEDGRRAARVCARNVLAALKAACEGEWQRVRRCVRLQGYVASTDDFDQQSQVVNGASDLMVDVLGESGRHSRVAVGVNTLPLDAPVELSAVFAVDPEL